MFGVIPLAVAFGRSRFYIRSFERDDYHAVAGLFAVECCGGLVLEDTHALDPVGIEFADLLRFDSVDDIERFVHCGRCCERLGCAGCLWCSGRFGLHVEHEHLTLLVAYLCNMRFASYVADFESRIGWNAQLGQACGVGDRTFRRAADLDQRTGERGFVLIGGDADGHLLLLLLLRRVGQVVGGGKAGFGISYQGYGDRFFVVYGDGSGLVADITDFEFTAFEDCYHGPAVFAGDSAFFGADCLYERSFDRAFAFFIHHRERCRAGLVLLLHRVGHGSYVGRLFGRCGCGRRGDDHRCARGETECAQQSYHGGQRTCQPQQAVPAFCLHGHHFKAFFS